MGTSSWQKCRRHAYADLYKIYKINGRAGVHTTRACANIWNMLEPWPARGPMYVDIYRREWSANEHAGDRPRGRVHVWTACLDQQGPEAGPGVAQGCLDPQAAAPATSRRRRNTDHLRGLEALARGEAGRPSSPGPPSVACKLSGRQGSKPHMQGEREGHLPGATSAGAVTKSLIPCRGEGCSRSRGREGRLPATTRAPGGGLKIASGRTRGSPPPPVSAAGRAPGTARARRGGGCGGTLRANGRRRSRAAGGARGRWRAVGAHPRATATAHSWGVLLLPRSSDAHTSHRRHSRRRQRAA